MKFKHPLAASALLLAGCDDPKPRDPPPPLPIVSPAPGSVKDRLPAWSRDLMGKPLAGLFPDPAGICIGNADNVQARFGPPSPGAEIVGWGWDPQAKAPIARVLLTNAAGVVAGAGEPGIPRPDVTAARPEVTAADTGWAAYTDRTRGPLDVFGVIEGGAALCRLGRVDLG